MPDAPVHIGAGLMRIDAHHHLWTLARGDYGWLTSDLAPIYRDFRLADLAPLSCGPDRGHDPGAGRADRGRDDVLARYRGNSRDGARRGRLDRFRCRRCRGRIDALAARNCWSVCGRWCRTSPTMTGCLQPALAPSLAAMARHGLVFDALVLPRHLPRLLQVDRPPSRSAIRAGPLRQAATCHRRHHCLEADEVALLARRPNIVCKLSGLVTEAAPDWQIDGSAPGGGSRPRLLRAAAPDVGKRLAGRRSRGRL